MVYRQNLTNLSDFEGKNLLKSWAMKGSTMFGWIIPGAKNQLRW